MESNKHGELDLQQLSLDILTLVNSYEFKNKEFIYDQHMMIKEEIGKTIKG